MREDRKFTTYLEVSSFLSVCLPLSLSFLSICLVISFYSFENQMNVNSFLHTSSMLVSSKQDANGPNER